MNLIRSDRVKVRTIGYDGVQLDTDRSYWIIIHTAKIIHFLYLASSASATSMKQGKYLKCLVHSSAYLGTQATKRDIISIIFLKLHSGH